MENYKMKFIEFMVRSGALMFGDFVTKSGRKTPFFINTGKYETAEQMAALGEYYARCVIENLGGDVDVLFGPAYKGIPLAVTAAVALVRQYGHDVSICFNRKEIKDHGEGGAIIGRRVCDGDRVVIVEDVITAGTSIRESVSLLNAMAKVAFKGIIVSVDRMEKGAGGKSALAEIRDTFGIRTFPIVTIVEIVEYLHGRTIDGRVVIDDAMRRRIEEYREEYGARDG